MKFPVFRELRVFRQSRLELQDIVDYLSTSMAKNLRELFTGLTKLSFADNFESFTATTTIAAGTEVPIRNELNAVPTGKIIVKADNNAVVDGDADNDENFVYLKNPSGSSAEVTVIWFK
jgi:hypothetical protein